MDLVSLKAASNIRVCALRVQFIIFWIVMLFQFIPLHPVMDSIKYGLPAGVFLFVLFFLHWGSQLAQFTLLRWFVGPVVVIGISLWMIRNRNKVYFPMKYAWFSGFTVLFVALAVQALLTLLFSGELMDPGEAVVWSQIWYVCFLEFIGQSFTGMIIITAFSIFLKKDNPNGNRR